MEDLAERNLMKRSNPLRLVALCTILLSVLLLACLQPQSQISPPPTIRSFASDPDSGPAALTVDFTWDADELEWDTDREQMLEVHDHRCALYIVPPGTDDPEAVHIGTCENARFTESLEKAGLYEAVLIVNSGDAEEKKTLQSAFDEHKANGVDPEWLENRAIRRSILIEVTEPEIVEAPGVPEITVPEAPANGDQAPSVWRLVETDLNPHGLSVEAEIRTSNPSHAGSFKECDAGAGTITFWYVVKSELYGDLANVMWTYEFDAPPPSVEPGETITLSHSLSVAGEVKVGGGATPWGQAGYTTSFWQPKTLKIASASLNDERYPTKENGTVEFTFPTSGNWFGLEASILEDSELPNIACDVAWWYERDDTVQQ